MVSWNKEKLVCAVSALILVVTLLIVVAFGSLGGELYENLIRDPRPGHFSPLAEENVDWYRLEAQASARDPFQPISEWKAPQSDPLPPPPLARLTRRVPLPGLLRDSDGARPPREAEMPETAQGQMPEPPQEDKKGTQ